MSESLDEYERIGIRFEVSIYRLARELYPGSERILDALAAALGAAGRHAEALLILDELLQLAPDDPRILYNRACALSLLGRVEDGLDALEAAIRAGFDDFEHMTRDPDLRPLRTRPEFQSMRAMAMEQCSRRVTRAD